MEFIELTGKTLLDVVNEGEIDLKQLHDAGVNGDSILRINSRGPIPTGLPDLQLGFIAIFSNFQHMIVVIEYAITLAALGAIDSLLTSLVRAADRIALSLQR